MSASVDVVDSTCSASGILSTTYCASSAVAGSLRINVGTCTLARTGRTSISAFMSRSARTAPGLAASRMRRASALRGCSRLAQDGRVGRSRSLARACPTCALLPGSGGRTRHASAPMGSRGAEVKRGRGFASISASVRSGYVAAKRTPIAPPSCLP